MTLEGPGKRIRDAGIEGPRNRTELRKIGIEELVQQCLAGEEAAWREFLGRYADLIYSTIHRKVGLSEEDRDDVFQSVIVAIHANLPRLRSPDRIVPWIVQIAYRQGVNRIRARSRSPEVAFEDVDEAALLDSGEMVRETRLPGEELLQLERAQRARELLEKLPARCRTLLEYLFYADPVPEYAEIARKVGIPIGSIGPTRARCLAKMRDLWEASDPSSKDG